MSVYLSRILFDVRSRHSQRLIADCHELHRSLMQAFPQAPGGVSARDYFGVLFRGESVGAHPHMYRVLVQSQHKPDWSCIPDHTLATSPDERSNPVVRSIDHEYAILDEGTNLSFRLRANPTKRVNTRNMDAPAEVRGKRLALSSDDDRIAWLVRHAARAGFEVVRTDVQLDERDVRITPQPQSHGWKKRDLQSHHRLTFGSVTFEGILRVTDQEQFRQALLEGIGPGKAYGFGLLSIALVGAVS